MKTKFRGCLDVALIVVGLILVVGPLIGPVMMAEPTQSSLVETFRLNQLAGDVKDLKDQKLDLRVALIEAFIAQEKANANWIAASSAGSGLNLIGLVGVYSHMRRRLPQKP